MAGMVAAVAAIALQITSCGLYEIGGDGSDKSQTGIWGGPVKDNDGAGVLEQICYMTALDYQKDYDWRADRGQESVKCSLVVYADGRQIMKVPVGEEYETASDPDMHRMIGGHLYTDYSTSDETVIKKDGTQLFRYPGRELICGMEIVGDDLYTLGQNRNGEGFAYRRNGEIVLTREDASLMGPLYRAGDSLAFAFYESIRASEGQVDRYFAARNGKVSQIAVRDDIRKVWGVMCGKETEIYVASLVGVDAPVLSAGGKMTTLTLPKGATLISASMTGNPDDVIVELLYQSGGALYSAFWKGGKILVTFPKGRTVSSICSHGDGLCCTVNPSDKASSGLIYRCGDQYDMPSGYSCVGADAICMVNGILHVGLSSYDGAGPIIWKDGYVEELRINGYVASISAL